MNRSLAAVALVTLCSIAHASPASDTNNGFLTGKLFRGGSPSLRTAYVIGMLDGFSYAPAFGAPDKKTAKLQLCVGAMHADAESPKARPPHGKSAPSSINTSMRIPTRGMRRCNRSFCARCGRLARPTEPRSTESPCSAAPSSDGAAQLNDSSGQRATSASRARLLSRDYLPTLS
jgi:hypothetical protein